MEETRFDRKLVEQYLREMDHGFDPKFLNKAGRVIDFLRLPKRFFDSCEISGFEKANKFKENKLFIFLIIVACQIF